MAANIPVEVAMIMNKSPGWITLEKTVLQEQNSMQQR